MEESDLQKMNNDIINNNITKKIISYTSFRNVFSDITKRSIDLLSGIVGMLFLVPITILVLVSNLINKENGPIFFTQERIGKKGKIFKMYKFRTMVVGAEDILKKHIEEQTDIGKEYLQHKKIKNDPRVTKIRKIFKSNKFGRVSTIY